MPKSATRAAATSSCVDRGLEAQRTTSAPPAFSARARLPVSLVTWRQADRRRPAQGLLLLEALADPGENGHRAVGPLHAQAALRGEREVLDVVGGEGGGRHAISFWPCADSRTASTMYVARATSPDSEGTR